MCDLVTALKVIRDECKRHEDCPTCPLRTLDNRCSIVSLLTPEGWEFAEEKFVAPRVFK